MTKKNVLGQLSGSAEVQDGGSVHADNHGHAEGPQLSAGDEA